MAINPQFDFKSKYTQTNWLTKRILNGFYEELFKLINMLPQLENYYEIGCGEGFSTQKILNHLHKQNKATLSYNACDIEDRLISEAKSKIPSIQIDNINIYDISKKLLNKIDMIFLLEVLEHLEDPVKALDQISRLNTKYLIASVPNEPLWSRLNLLRGKYWKYYGNTPGHVQKWSTANFLQLLKSYGNIVTYKTPLPWTIALVKLNN